MKRLLIVAAIAVIAVPTLAGPDVMPIDGVGYLRYDVATGEITPVTAETRRLGPPVWDCSYDLVSSFWIAEPDLGEGWIDWGDITIGQAIGGCEFSQFTNSQDSDGDLFIVILFYEEENGWNTAGRSYVTGFLLNNVPASTHPLNEYWGYVWGVELNEPFVLDGSDLDGDGLGDFGYFGFFSGRTPAANHGPAIAGLIDPNNLPPECPGIENAFDLFPNAAYNDGPNNIDPNAIAYEGTYWFGGNPFSQFHFVLFAPACPNRGDADRYCSADIDGSFDCLVGLADLAQLLGNYGMTTGAVPMDGDIDPYDEWWPGDGDVDLADLAELLMQYGNDCTEP
jgi:hypothetical protein